MPKVLRKNEAVTLLNHLGQNSKPFDFYCDFPGEAWKINHEESVDFKLEINHHSKPRRELNKPVFFKKKPVSYSAFSKSFDYVINQINLGNSFLTNLTFETCIETSVTLDEIFEQSIAKYKLLAPGQFVVFSPETFIQINGNTIYSFPMKGTINAEIPNAQSIILNDVKETAEHITIVDLIRNDLSQVASQVSVSRFRYLDEIHTNEKHLLQVSSEVTGKLPDSWRSQIGDILVGLLPAGSISGAPKPQTLKIIQEAESYHRGFYTGICGRFDGKNLDTGVMIRFLKKDGDQLVYCSGGGITSFSDAQKEYQEMIDKVYLPI